MPSFAVPHTDDQIDVDTEGAVVMLFRNAWNRDSCGTPDETHTFAALRQNPEVLDRLTAMLVAAEAAELRHLVG
ncbi:MAG: hypothetical protein QG655_3368 [Actinomycetota bacterium]|nr:hypothetical protein [Actinomycetota bacterium]HPY25090.1 hypothetical protein [Mycobacterium sp.]